MDAFAYRVHADGASLADRARAAPTLWLEALEQQMKGRARFTLEGAVQLMRVLLHVVSLRSRTFQLRIMREF